MNDFMLLSAAARYPLKSLDIGEFADIRGRGMRFHTRVYDAQGAGRLCLMEMEAFLGIMKMESAVFSPVELDGPLYSCDAVDAMGDTTLLLELYDTTLSHPDMEPVGELKAKYASLPAHDPGSHWYDSMRLPVSDFKKGKRKRGAFAEYAKAYTELYFSLLPGCGSCNSAEKCAKNAAYADGLLRNGGPAVDTFQRLVGAEKAAVFLRRYMFCCEK